MTIDYDPGHWLVSDDQRDALAAHAEAGEQLAEQCERWRAVARMLALSVDAGIRCGTSNDDEADAIATDAGLTRLREVVTSLSRSYDEADYREPA